MGNSLGSVVREPPRCPPDFARAGRPRGLFSIRIAIPGLPQSLRLTSRLLGLEPTFFGRPTGSGRTATGRRRRRGLTQELRKALLGGPTVLQLRPMLGRRDHHGAPHERSSQPMDHPGTEIPRQSRRIHDVERQLDPRVRRVHALPTRTGGPRESPRSSDAGIRIESLTSMSSVMSPAWTNGSQDRHRRRRSDVTERSSTPTGGIDAAPWSGLRCGRQPH